jgi:hypothetical protein
MAQLLGWLSLALGMAELMAPRQIAQALGMQGKENLIRAYGIREISAGMLTLSVDKHLGLWSRELGDGMDIATLMMALRADNPKRRNVAAALGLVLGVTLLDAAVARATTLRHSPEHGQKRSYRDRSGFPQGIKKARGAAARDLHMPQDMRATPVLPFRANGPRRAHGGSIADRRSRRSEAQRPRPHASA